MNMHSWHLADEGTQAMNCPYCRAAREAGDGHYGVCPVLKMSRDPKAFPKLDGARSTARRRGRATGRRGHGRGGRKKFTRKAKR